MTIQELLKKINNKTFDLEKQLEIKKYIPIMDKKLFTMDVIAACTDEIDDFISVDRFKMNIYFDMKMLGAYTNLEIAADFDGMIEQYDCLCEDGTLTKIIAAFSDDYDAMCDVLENELEELLIQNSIDAQVVKTANKINKLIDMISDKMETVDFNSILPDGTNVNELVEMLKILK